ncbi:excisionase [Luteimonas gilva]|uniref:Excisionase n=1 Tax=Luteimonas gilva TaxID=2572684 RepID=A0A4U5JVZ9_9GAMM|nr:excisionase [Luteimonas gilva]
MTIRYVTIKKFEELTGYTTKAVQSKMARGDWLLDREYLKAPDGRILMDLQGFERWVESSALMLADRVTFGRPRRDR